MLPVAVEACPTIETGRVTILDTEVELWLGSKLNNQKRPIVIGWHGVALDASSLFPGLGLPIVEVLNQGGLVIALDETTGNGTEVVGTAPEWFTGDFEVVDQVVACSLEQLDIDTRRIYTVGDSVGGIQAGIMAYQRSGYIAAAVTNSGGVTVPELEIFQDSSHLPAVMTMHGAEGVELWTDFSEPSNNLNAHIASDGGFAIDCEHDGTHCNPPMDLKLAAWEFMLDHPFGVDPEPYTEGLPESFPDYCAIQTELE